MSLTIKYHYGCSDSCIDKVPILPVERSHPAKPAFHRMGSHSEPFRPAKQAFHRTKPFLSQPKSGKVKQQDSEDEKLGKVAKIAYIRLGKVVKTVVKHIA